MKTDQVKALAAEIETANIVAINAKPGRGGGTFVVKELVYGYAMWISPAFNLKVIRAYDAMVAKPQPQAPQSFSEALRL